MRFFCCQVYDEFVFKMKWVMSRENMTLLNANNIGADQPAHHCSLDSDLFIHLLESIMIKPPSCTTSIF